MNGHTEEKNIAAEEDSPFFAGSHDYLMMLNLYDSAVKQLRLKFEVLNNEFSVTYARNPIRHIESRLKSPESIVAKLRKRGKPLTIASALENINDIAGVRVVCRYIDDVYAVADMLLRQPDVTLVKMQDYIKTPNYNGYRSLHLDLKVPVYFSDRTEYVLAEVQIRTVAMDFWASLEHKLKYKKDIDTAQVISQDLCFCAELISQLDGRMQQIRERLEEKKDNTQSNITGV